MTYYENLIKHVHSVMKRHPGSPVAMTTDTFEVVASGKNVRKMAAAIRKGNARGRTMAVFQMPNSSQTLIY